MVLRLLSMIIPLASMLCLWSQETNVKPGINDSFENPNIERLTDIFEGESREVFRFRKSIVEKMAIKPGQVIADIGAGTGLFSLLMADDVGEKGKVIAVDISQELLDHIEKRAEKAGVETIALQLCTQKQTGLKPESIDIAFICDTYHHIEYPDTYMRDVLAALKPNGRLVIVDFRREEGVNQDWVMGHVRLNQAGVVAEVESVGFTFLNAIDLMKTQFMIVFRKPE